MQLSALASILLILAAPSVMGGRNHQHRHNAALAHNRHVSKQHERSVEKLSANVDRRESLAQEFPVAKAKRVVKRGANGKACRTRTSSLTSASATSASATSTSASATSTPAASAATLVAASAASTTDTTSTESLASAATATVTASSSSATVDAAWVAQGSMTSSSAAAAATSSTPPANVASGDSSSAINGVKWLLSGGDGFDAIKSKIGSWYDWNAISGYPGNSASGVSYIPMLWGDGSTGSQDSQRLSDFKSLSVGSGSPSHILGFYEPDCDPPMSSAIDPATAASLWNQLVVPHRTSGGSVLISPGLCKQKDENWMQPFLDAVGSGNQPDWIALHINKPDLAGAQADVNYYAKYNLPMFISEFACVNDQDNFTPCSDQGQIDQFISDMVNLCQTDSRIVGCGLSGGAGLGNQVPMSLDGTVTSAGWTYINAI